MAALAWDEFGDRVFHTGIDRGVLYLDDGRFAAWNGLIGVEDTPLKDTASYFYAGVKYLEKITPGDFSGKLRAFTYPDEFDEVNGVSTPADGLSYYDQPSRSFGLSYRTGLGNDTQGTEYGYKIHLLYNLVADPDSVSYETYGNPLKPAEFAWALTGTPVAVRQGRPTVHISIDSTKTEAVVLQAIEDILYGTDTTSPRLPLPDEVKDLYGAIGVLIIVDNGDGTWTAIDQGDEYITMLDATTFKIDNADATYLDASTYTITTTNP